MLLMRLPWEMMHDGVQFLAVRPGPLVLIARDVQATGVVLAVRTFAPRVLFVVGAAIDDPDVRPGAEYLGLLRRLESIDQALDCRVLMDASAERLADAVASFRPTVVHFICHGTISRGRGALRLRASDPALPAEDCTAAQLLALIAPEVVTTIDGVDHTVRVPCPSVVLINACYSATPPAPLEQDASPDATEVFGNGMGTLPTRTASAPLAAELVAGDGLHAGPAIVIGMGGRVADLACRLFTRQFYQALLRGDPLWAAAAGRRGAFTFGNQPEDSMHRATPVVFLERTAMLHVDPAEVVAATRRSETLRAFRRDADPSAFCGRLPFFEHLHALLRPGRAARRVFGISVSDQPPKSHFRVGRSRLLQEMAAATVIAGHIPVLRLQTEGDPERARDLLGDRGRTGQGIARESDPVRAARPAGNVPGT